MAIVSRTQLKAWFRRGLYPLESQFHSWIDSFWHKNDPIPISSIENLAATLNDKAGNSHVHLMSQITGLQAALDNKSDTSHVHPQYVMQGDIDELQWQVNMLAQRPQGKSVVSVASGSDWSQVISPLTEVIYKTLDNSKLYLWDGEQFVEVTNNAVDNVIYVTSIIELLEINKPDGLYLVHRVAQGAAVSDTFTLVITSDCRTLHSDTGWAKRTSLGNAYQWTWYNYSYTGHTHAISDVDGLSVIIESVSDISTIRSNALLACQRTYTLDFGTVSELIQDMNLMGTITVNRIEKVNVAALYVSFGTAVIRQQITSNVVSFNVPDGATITWEIVRTNENQPACVGVRYTIQDNSNQNQQES